MTRRRTHPHVVDFVLGKTPDFTPKEIVGLIDRDPYLRTLGVPSLRTVQSIVSERRAATPTTPDGWTLFDADPHDVGLVLSVIAERPDLGWDFDPAQIARLGWLLRAVSDIPPAEAVSFARRLAANEPDLAARLVPYLALTPWRDGGVRYVAAVAAGRVRRLLLTSHNDAEFQRWTASVRATR